MSQSLQIQGLLHFKNGSVNVRSMFIDNGLKEVIIKDYDTLEKWEQSFSER